MGCCHSSRRPWPRYVFPERMVGHFAAQRTGAPSVALLQKRRAFQIIMCKTMLKMPIDFCRSITRFCLFRATADCKSIPVRYGESIRRRRKWGMAKGARLPSHVKRDLIAGIIGKVPEWYDSAVFGYLAAVISQQFFPSGTSSRPPAFCQKGHYRDCSNVDVAFDD
jgi:hypothetical protein